MTSIYNEIMLAAQSLLAQREHSQKQLMAKLQRKGFQQQAIEAVMDQLIEQRLQSDARYGEACIHSRVRKGYGPNFIKQYLQQQGLESALIEQLLTQIQISWPAEAMRVWHKKFAVLPETPKQKAKQQQFLYYRGFDSSTIQTLFETLSAQY